MFEMGLCEIKDPYAFAEQFITKLPKLATYVTQISINFDGKEILYLDVMIDNEVCGHVSFYEDGVAFMAAPNDYVFYCWHDPESIPNICQKIEEQHWLKHSQPVVQ